MQLAVARADVALDAAVLQDVPIAPRFTLDGLIHVAAGLGFRDLIINGDQATVGQDANGFAKHDIMRALIGSGPNGENKGEKTLPFLRVPNAAA